MRDPVLHPSTAERGWAGGGRRWKEDPVTSTIGPFRSKTEISPVIFDAKGVTFPPS
jgi:hypothetical protein